MFASRSLPQHALLCEGKIICLVYRFKAKQRAREAESDDPTLFLENQFDSSSEEEEDEEGQEERRQLEHVFIRFRYSEKRGEPKEAVPDEELLLDAKKILGKRLKR